jgi:hydrogenase maturation protease
MEPRTSLVVALGNPLVGADGFGAAVLDRVRGLPGLREVADVLDAHTDLLGQIERLAQYQRVILVDAIVGREPSGRVDVYDERRFAEWPDTSPGCHQISPLLAVRLLRQLHPGASPQVLLVGLTVNEVSRAAGVSDVAVEAGARLVTELLCGSSAQSL